MRTRARVDGGMGMFLGLLDVPATCSVYLRDGFAEIH